MKREPKQHPPRGHRDATGPSLPIAVTWSPARIRANSCNSRKRPSFPSVNKPGIQRPTRAINLIFPEQIRLNPTDLKKIFFPPLKRASSNGLSIRILASRPSSTTRRACASRSLSKSVVPDRAKSYGWGMHDAHGGISIRWTSSTQEKSARGLAHFKTLSRVKGRRPFRQVLDCGSPLPLLEVLKRCVQ